MSKLQHWRLSYKRPRKQSSSRQWLLRWSYATTLFLLLSEFRWRRISLTVDFRSWHHCPSPFSSSYSSSRLTWHRERNKMMAQSGAFVEDDSVMCDGSKASRSKFGEEFQNSSRNFRRHSCDTRRSYLWLIGVRGWWIHWIPGEVMDIFLGWFDLRPTSKWAGNSCPNSKMNLEKRLILADFRQNHGSRVSRQSSLIISTHVRVVRCSSMMMRELIPLSITPFPALLLTSST